MVPTGQFIDTGRLAFVQRNLIRRFRAAAIEQIVRFGDCRFHLGREELLDLVATEVRSRVDIATNYIGR